MNGRVDDGKPLATEELFLLVQSRLLELYFAPLLLTAAATGTLVNRFASSALNSEHVTGWSISTVTLVALTLASAVGASLAVRFLWLGTKPDELLTDPFVVHHILFVPQKALAAVILLPIPLLALSAIPGLQGISIIWASLLSCIPVMAITGSSGLHRVGAVIVSMGLLFVGCVVVGGPQCGSAFLALLLLCSCGAAINESFFALNDSRVPMTLFAATSGSILPIIFVFSSQYVLVTCLSVLSALVLSGVCFIRWHGARASLQAQLVDSSPFANTPSASVDVVRTNDGFSRVCMPAWRPILPSLSSGGGYIYNLGGENDPCFSGLTGDFTVIRQTCLTDAPISSHNDQVAASIRDFVFSCLPRLQSADVAGLAAFSSALQSPSPVISLSVPKNRVIAKMPWDDPMLIIVPHASRRMAFEMPVFLGIFDREGTPCGAHSIEVEIQLSKSVLEALREYEEAAIHGDTVDERSRRLCQCLAWNSRAIVPAIYYAIMRIIGRSVAGIEVPLFGDEMSVARERVVSDCRSQIGKELPSHIRELMSVEVLSMSLDSHLAAEREGIEAELRVERLTRGSSLSKSLSLQIQRFYRKYSNSSSKEAVKSPLPEPEDLLSEKGNSSGLGTDSEIDFFANPGVIAQFVDEYRSRLRSEAQHFTSVVNSQFAALQAKESRAPGINDAMKSVRQRYERFSEELETALSDADVITTQLSRTLAGRGEVEE